MSKLLGRDRMAEIVSLRFFALMNPEKGQFLLCFHALGDHAQFKASSHTDYGGDDGGFFRTGGDLTNERLIDFKASMGNFLR